MKRAALILSLVLGAGCVTAPPRTEQSPRNYPVERPPPPADMTDRDENPSSQAWPLDRWFVEFENLNGVELKYRSQDTFGHTVVQPRPGPFDSDQDALDALRVVCRKSGLTLVEVGPHIYRIRRLDGIR